MLMQNFGVTNKELYGMLWYFWSGQFTHLLSEESKGLNSMAEFFSTMNRRMPQTIWYNVFGGHGSLEHFATS